MRPEEAAGSATVEVVEETKPTISLEELVQEMPARRDEPSATPAPVPAEEAVAKASPPAGISGLRTARIVAVDGRRATIALRGSHDPIAATIAPEVEIDLLEEAATNRDHALVEMEPGAEPVIVGLVQTRRPREVRVTGERIVVEGEREVLLRAGRAALRLREDGDVELVGSRISAASRGLFRIVGRILRLN